MNSDIVSNLQADVIASNKTLAEVNVTWKPPKNPNGFVVAYIVYYSRVEDNLAVCIVVDYTSNVGDMQLSKLC